MTPELTGASKPDRNAKRDRRDASVADRVGVIARLRVLRLRAPSDPRCYEMFWRGRALEPARVRSPFDCAPTHFMHRDERSSSRLRTIGEDGRSFVHSKAYSRRIGAASRGSPI